MIIQSITIRWNKEVRGAPYSSLRNQYNKAFLIPESIFNNENLNGTPYHDLLIVQNKDGFKTIYNRCLFLESSQDCWKIGCVEVQRIGLNYEFVFRYSNFCGKPVRYDSNYNLLTEKAFNLSPSEYGRILYNGRYTSIDTGEWYYELHILNAFNTSEINPKILVNRTPVKDYKQLEILF